jgi:alanine dehydrogenase
MAAQPLLLSEMDLRPLISDPTQMDSLIVRLEHATLRHFHQRVRERGFVDQTQTARHPNTVQFGFAADDQEVSGFQVFAEGSSGNDPTLPNARFITLLHPETRQLTALVDYRSLSPLRVGASAGIGLRYLAPDGARTAAVLGSHQQARTQLQAIRRTVPALERARVYSPTPAHREQFASETSQWLDLPVEPVTSARAAIDGADVIAVANNSGDPIVDVSWLKPGSLVISIGGSRMPPEIMQTARVVATTRDRLATREPYASAIKSGMYSMQHAAADLGELIFGQASPRQEGKTIVFELDRLNIWAVATAQWAYDWALERSVGTPFTLSSE